MCAEIGRAYGLRTGLFTSPHLVRFNERIQVDGVEIGDEAFARLQRRIEAAIAEVSKRLNQQFGAFEALFALSCLHFQESGCDFAVFEAGIGGRYDPVRLVGARETCVTSVDYEHVELLGNTLELIASDKSDACAAGGTIIYGENCRDLRPHLVEYNRWRGCTPLFVRDDIRIDNEVTAASGQRFDFRFGDHDFRRLELSLPGAFQVNNSAIAVTLFLLWLQREQPREACGPDRGRDTRRPARDALARPPRNHPPGPAHRDRRRPHPRRHPAIAGEPDGDPRRRTTGSSSPAPRATRRRTKSSACWRSLSIQSSPRRHTTRERTRSSIAAAARRANAGADVHVAATIERRCGSPRSERRRKSSEGYMWQADYSWRSNMQLSRRAAAPRIWTFSERGAQSVHAVGWSSSRASKKAEYDTA